MTSAAGHDGAQLRNVVAKDNTASTVWADSAGSFAGGAESYALMSDLGFPDAAKLPRIRVVGQASSKPISQPISFERLRDQIYEARVLAEEEICRLKAGIIEVESCS